jgi:hypothetical protein
MPVGTLYCHVGEKDLELTRASDGRHSNFSDPSSPGFFASSSPPGALCSQEACPHAAIPTPTPISPKRPLR